MLVEVIDGNVVGYKTVKEMSKIWDISTTVVLQYVHENRTPYIKIGDQFFIPENTKKPNKLTSISSEEKIVDGIEYMTVKEAAIEWEMFPEDIYKLIYKDKIKYIKTGGLYGNKFILIPKDEPKPDLSEEKHQKVLNIEAIKRSLKRNGIDDLTDLQNMTRDDILNFRTIGPAKLRIIIELMNEQGMKFKEE